METIQIILFDDENPYQVSDGGEKYTNHNFLNIYDQLYDFYDA